ncbi:MAG: rod shape-determining protein MreD [Magnetococcales bacterium]|nr:rod shape-determining protein MreD [Magnetococcales bacterium]
MMVSLLIPWLPAMTIFMAAVVQEMALPFAAWSVFRPDLVLIGLFYWRLYRPDRCGPILALLSGLLVDVVSGAPLGLNAVSNIILVLLIGRFGRLIRSIDFFYLLFVLLFFVCLAEGIQLALAAMKWGSAARWPLLTGRPVATVLIAPMVIHLLVTIHQSWLEEPHARR